jgi:hypothetical protein
MLNAIQRAFPFSSPRPLGNVTRRVFVHTVIDRSAFGCE